ncbi:hypothetical protein JCM8547_005259 [Rhodosporidiobolus lusitaniae]
MARSVVQHSSGTRSDDEHQSSSPTTLNIRQVASSSSPSSRHPSPLPTRRWSNDTVHADLVTPDSSSPGHLVQPGRFPASSSSSWAPLPSTSTRPRQVSWTAARGTSVRSFFGHRAPVEDSSSPAVHSRHSSTASSSAQLPPSHSAHTRTASRSFSFSAITHLTSIHTALASSSTVSAAVAPSEIKSKLRASGSPTSHSHHPAGKLVSPSRVSGKNLAKATLLGRAKSVLGKSFKAVGRKRKEKRDKRKVGEKYVDDMASVAATVGSSSSPHAVQEVEQGEKRKKRPRTSGASGRSLRQSQATYSSPATVTRVPVPSSGSVRRRGYGTAVIYSSGSKKRVRVTMPSSGSAKKLINRPRPVSKSASRMTEEGFLRTSQSRPLTRVEGGSLRLSTAGSRRTMNASTRSRGMAAMQEDEDGWKFVDEMGRPEPFPELQQQDESGQLTSPYDVLSSPTPGSFIRSPAPSPLDTRSYSSKSAQHQPLMSTPTTALANFGIKSTPSRSIASSVYGAEGSSPAIYSTPSAWPLPPSSPPAFDSPISPSFAADAGSFLSSPGPALPGAFVSPRSNARRSNAHTLGHGHPRPQYLTLSQLRETHTPSRMSSSHPGSSDVEILAGSTPTAPAAATDSTPTAPAASRFARRKEQDDLEAEISEMLASPDLSRASMSAMGAFPPLEIKKKRRNQEEKNEEAGSPFKDAPDDTSDAGDWVSDAGSIVSSSSRASNSVSSSSSDNEEEAVVVTSARRCSVEREFGIVHKASLSSLRHRKSGSGSGSGGSVRSVGGSPLSPIFASTATAVVTSPTRTMAAAGFPSPTMRAPGGRVVSTSFVEKYQFSSTAVAESTLPFPPPSPGLSRSLGFSTIPNLSTNLSSDRVATPYPPTPTGEGGPAGGLSSSVGPATNRPGMMRNPSGREWRALPTPPLALERSVGRVRDYEGTPSSASTSTSMEKNTTTSYRHSVAGFPFPRSSPSAHPQEKKQQQHRISSSLSSPFANLVLPSLSSTSSSSSRTGAAAPAPAFQRTSAFPLPQTGSQKALVEEKAREVFGSSPSSSSKPATGAGEGGGLKLSQVRRKAVPQLGAEQEKGMLGKTVRPGQGGGAGAGGGQKSRSPSRARVAGDGGKENEEVGRG